MIVFLSDVHYGRGSYEDDRRMEEELITCLRHLERRVDALYLLGDIYDCYIEYEHLIPKGLPRLQALIAEWTSAGVPVTYLVGNHDPWHREYFSRELGVDLQDGPIRRRLQGHDVYLAHGDGIAPSKPLYRVLKPLLRNPILVALYRTLLPAAVGMGLGRWYSRTFAEDTPDPNVVEELRAHAHRTLESTKSNLAIMGHSHHPETTRWEAGTYVNCGSWYFDRTLTILDSRGVSLQQWNGNQTLLVEQSRAVTRDGQPE